MQYRQVRTFGGKGAGAEQFSGALRAITVDARGHVLAAAGQEVKVFDAAGKLLRRWSTASPAHSVAVAQNGTVWVGETGQIEIFDPAGKLLNAWRHAQLLGRVTAIGFTSDGVIAADAATRTIRHFDRQARLRNNIGRDNPVNGFLIPNGVLDFAVDDDGVIHAANPGKHRVERYSADGKLLGHLGRFHGTDPAGFTGCCNPTNIAVGAGIFVTEKGGPRAKAYDREGNLLAVIATDAFDANAKNMPIAVDAQGAVFVADTARNTILVFEAVKA